MTISIFFVQLLKNHINIINKEPCINSMGWSNTVGVIQILIFFRTLLDFIIPTVLSPQNTPRMNSHSLKKFVAIDPISTIWFWVLQFNEHWNSWINSKAKSTKNRIQWILKKKPQFQRETISTIRHGLKQFIKHSH